MQKIKFIVLDIFFLLIVAACVQAQSTQTPELPTASPTSMSSPTSRPTETAVPIPTETAVPVPTVNPTSPPAITDASRLLWVSSSADLFNRVISVDPDNPQRIAYCAPDQIRLSLDGGQTWEEAIPTHAISAVAEESGYTIFDSASACISVTLDPEYPGSFFIVFATAQEQFGAPPIFYMGFFTTDNGSTWQLVSPPPSATLEGFGGFWNLGGETIEALFTKPGQISDPSANILVQETADGGRTWQPGELSCPQSGPCLRWGPAASSIPGMGSPLPQGILVSSDRGQTWSVVDPPVELRAPSPNQLAAFSDQEIAIISGSSALTTESEAPPLRLSEDSGLTWQMVALPPISLENADLNYYPGLQILPDESFLAQSPESSTWFWLSSSDSIWCPINSDDLPIYPVLLQSVADQLWWVDPEDNEARHISLSEITCAES
jgi:hypothetical protein